MIIEFKGEYRWLSNFVEVEVEWEGRIYKSVEHAYQSAKSLDKEWKRFCRSDVSSGKVKRASKDIEIRDDWEVIKKSVMKNLLIKKFSDERFRSKLLATGNTYIIEGNTWGDTFWGVDMKSGEGENILGLMIMEIRSSLKNEFSN